MARFSPETDATQNTDEDVNNPYITARQLHEDEQQAAFDRDFNDMTAPENFNKDAESKQEDSAISRAGKQLSDKESAGGSWANKTGSKTTSLNVKKRLLKKVGPIGTIIIVLLLGFAGLTSFIGGPGLLIVNFAQVLENQLNQRLPSFSVRANRIVQAKLENTTKGCALGSIRCKYSTFSEKEIDNFKKSGIEVKTKRTSITGRYKIEAFTFDGKDIPARQFSRTMRTVPAFSKAIQQAYGGVGDLQFASTWDKISSKVRNKLQLSRAYPFPPGDTTDEARLKTLADKANSDPDDLGRASVDCDANDKECQSQRDKYNNVSDELKEQAEAAQKDGRSLAGQVGKMSSAGLSRAVGIFGTADAACSVVGGALGVSRSVKLVKSRKMLQVAMLVIVTGNAIMAGDAKPGDVSFVGKLLTDIKLNPDGTKTKSATESFGYRSIAFGDTGADQASIPYTLGANFGDKGSGVIAALIASKALGGSLAAARDKCKIIKNPVVQVFSIGAGVIALLIPGVNAIQAAKILGQGASALSLVFVMSMINAQIVDSLTGILFDPERTTAEDIGNMSVASFGNYHSMLNQYDASAPLTPEQAVENTAFNNDIRSQFAMYDRMDHSPFDASNPNTMLGSIYTRMQPTIQKIRSPSGTFSMLLSTPSTILSSLAPSKAHALTAEDYRNCDDIYIREINLAADEMCIPQYGIPKKYLNIDPIVVGEYLAERGMVDAETDTPSAQYISDFIDVCVERELPMGDTGENFQDPSGEDCFIESNTSGSWLGRKSEQEKAYMYLYAKDKNVDEMLVNGVSLEGETVGTQTNTPPSTDEFGIPEGAVADSNGGWTIVNGTDYSNIPCPDGVPSMGVTTNSLTGTKLMSCSIDNMRVSSLIAPRVIKLIADAKSRGITMTISSGLRTYEEQVRLYKQNCSNGVCNPPTAKPGTSNHEMGLAIDWGYKGSTICYPRPTCNPGENPAYEFLKTDGIKYGFRKLPSEAWHWSMNGG